MRCTPGGKKRLPRDADRLYAVVPSHFYQQREYGGMSVHVILRVHVVQRQARRGECRELRANLRFQLFANPRSKKIPESGAQQVLLEFSALVDEKRNAFGRKRRSSVHEYDVKPDSQRRHSPGAIYCIGGGGR